MTPTLQDQTRCWQEFAARVAELARDSGIDGIAIAGLIRYHSQPQGGITVLAYSGLSPALDREQTANLRGYVVAGIGEHFDRSVALLDTKL